MILFLPGYNSDMNGAKALAVGSSMGGWLMLLAALARPKRVVGLLGVAAAPDFTQRHLLLSGDGPVAIDAPVRLLHGQADQDVPFALSLHLAARISSPDVQVLLVKGGDHRLSRPADLAFLTTTLAAVLERP